MLSLAIVGVGVMAANRGLRKPDTPNPPTAPADAAPDG